MIGDAISHAVLPGIVLAYLFSGSKNSIYMLLGAIIFGLLTTFLIEFFNKQARVQEDASIGITFTSLFALGVILITVFASNIDLDQDCVLYGEIAYITLDNYTFMNIEIPKAVMVLSSVFILVLIILIACYRQLSLTSFDPYFAQSIGISTLLWHYVLMTLVSLVTVSSFESVGAILVVAFLTIPASTAYLLTNNLKVMIALSILFGMLASISGYFLALISNGSIAGAMATCSGLLFLMVFGFKLLFKKIKYAST